MKKYLLLFLTFITTVSFASPCKRIYTPEDSVGMVESRTCTLEWKDQKGINAVEVIYLKNGCQKIEGGDLQNCYITRTCPAGLEDEKFSSMPIMDNGVELDNFCTLSKPSMRVILGAADEHPKSPAHAEIKCIRGKAVSIVLKSPTNESKACLFK